jgi:hypothetical protein
MSSALESALTKAEPIDGSEFWPQNERTPLGNIPRSINAEARTSSKPSSKRSPAALKSLEVNTFR